ncbi:MAG: hypothetical protein ACRD72_24670, partial [Candidatus Angelobacter sp.]
LLCRFWEFGWHKSYFSVSLLIVRHSTANAGSGSSGFAAIPRRAIPQPARSAFSINHLADHGDIERRLPICRSVFPAFHIANAVSEFAFGFSIMLSIRNTPPANPKGLAVCVSVLCR